jgi:hypothetical protein
VFTFPGSVPVIISFEQQPCIYSPVGVIKHIRILKNP